MSSNASNRPSQLLLIRHAESARNKAKPGTVYFADDESRKMVKGIPDHLIPLTPQGFEQAAATGFVLRNRYGRPDYFYHSGYLRTIQTLERIVGAYPVSERAEIKVRMNQFIRERDSGYAYDMTTQEAEAAFPWLRDYWATFGGFFARPPGGESVADVTQRVHTFLNSLFRDRGGKKVWAVTHGGTIKAFRFLLERWNYEQALKWPGGEAPKHCSITAYEFDAREQRLVLKEYNTVYC